MVTDFPFIYPDELLYGVFGRYRKTDGNINIKKTMEELFSRTTAVTIIDIPCHIEELCNNIPESLGYSSEFFIRRCTLFPFYSPFMSEERRQECIEIIKHKNGSGLKTKMGIVAGGLCKKYYLYYCPNCIEYEMDNNIEPYIHRLHQVQGVFICDKHMCKLKAYKHVELNRLQYVCFDSDKIDYLAEYIEDKTLESRMLKIAKEVRYLLEHDLDDVLCQSAIKERYYSLLAERGYLTTGGSIKHSKFIEDFIKYHGAEFLCLFDSNIDVTNESNWLINILRRSNRVMHPIRHILLIDFLADNIEQFVGYNEEKKTYPCLNKHCCCYKKDDKTKYVVTADYKTREPVVTIACDVCGFIYSKKVSKGIYEIGTIKDYGYLWLEKLGHILKSGISKPLRAIARDMGCDCKTIVKYASNLGCGNLISSTMMINTAKKTADIKSSVKKNYEKSIIEYIRRHPHSSITEIKKARYKEYMWLYNHNKEWLRNHLPKPRKPMANIGDKVDWNKRDKELLQRLKKEYEILKNCESPVRITKTLLGRRCGKLDYIEKKLIKMPLSKMYLDSIHESVEEFQIRRVNYVCNELYNKNERLVEWKIKRVAGLKDKISNCVQDIINENIMKYSGNLHKINV